MNRVARPAAKDTAPPAALITFLSQLSLAGRSSNGVRFLRDLMASSIERAGKNRPRSLLATRRKEFPRLMVNRRVTS